MSNIVIPTITVNGQTILHTENKYCGENIEVNVAIPNPTLDGTAITDYVLAPYTFYKDNLTKLIGTMVNRGAISTDITTKAQEVTIQQGYHSGSGKVKISETEQAKIIASNIKSGVTILGQEGAVTPAKEEQTKTVSPTTSSQDVLPDTNKVLSKVTVNAIPTETKSQQPNLSSGDQVINATSGKFMTSFTITKDTVNHIASNIRSGKTLYGVEGSLQPAKEEETKTVTPNFASGNVVVTPTSGKVLSQVTVNKDTTNHKAENIKKDITLYGVTGTLEGGVPLEQFISFSTDYSGSLYGNRLLTFLSRNPRKYDTPVDIKIYYKNGSNEDVLLISKIVNFDTVNFIVIPRSYGNLKIVMSLVPDNDYGWNGFSGFYAKAAQPNVVTQLTAPSGQNDFVLSYIDFDVFHVVFTAYGD